MMITPKSARKHQRRQTQMLAEGHLRKITEHLQGVIMERETPAQAVKRLLDELNVLRMSASRAKDAA
ncbi:MAG: hypothetical protein L0220_16175 [Acidobacteria bacterium]|nr:hypothetical protein [Acidobacteriota bacterium]